ncbi:MAG: hypothetical protein ACHQNE_04500 [Candidatus Kapaibacterium sp.]
MNELHFTTEIDEQDRISVPAEVARKIPPHTPVDVQLHISTRKRLGKSNGALQYYMEHPIDMPGILPFDRNALYSDDA